METSPAEATAELLTTIQLNDKLPHCSDINSYPSARLPSSHPVWLNKPAPDVTAATSEWIDAWFNTTAVNQWLFYTPLVWGETASFGGDIGGQTPAGPGAEPLVRGSGGKAPRS